MKTRLGIPRMSCCASPEKFFQDLAAGSGKTPAWPERERRRAARRGAQHAGQDRRVARMNKPVLTLPPDSSDWLSSLKQRIQGARRRALLSANGEQIRLYHEIGCDILALQSRQGWGSKVIERLSSDLHAAFPDSKGYSARNLKYMQFFAQECPDGLIGQQPAAQLPWCHIVTPLTAAALGSPLADMKNGQPNDVAALIELLVGCNHWGGEALYDVARNAETSSALAEVKCGEVAVDEARTLKRDAKRPGVLQALQKAKEMSY